MDKQYGYTVPGADYPAYFNAILRGGQVVLTVRGPKQDDGSCGTTSEIALPPSVAIEIAIGIRDVAGEPSGWLALTEAQIKQMVDRFLQWKLPDGFRPDAGISFEPRYNVDNVHGWPEGKHEPSGTNLFDATQALAMVRHMLGLPVA